ncbi:MAG: acetate--CoA ligase family protein, partial [Burkholderiales bacterium]
FEHCGFVEVTDFEALVETAAFLAKAGRPSSAGVAALATSGGAAIMVADKAEQHGVSLPQPDAEVAALLRSHIPEFGSARNPCDVTAQILNTPEAMPACARALLKSPEFSALVIPHPYAYLSGTQRLQALAAVGSECGKPVCCVWLSQWLEEPGATVVEHLPGMAVFRSMDRCMRTLKAWHQRERFLRERERAQQQPAPGLIDAAARRTAADLLASAPGNLVTEGQAKRALALYGVPVVPERLVQDAEAAVRAATEVGFPVVLKVESPDVPHKTEAGGVALGLADAAAVREAFARVAVAVRQARPEARILGYLVQPMLARDLELIVGAKRDPSFGPVVVVGLGGVLAELLDDSVASLAPVSMDRALQMLDRLRGRALLDGFRGSAPVDRQVLADVICRISEFAAHHADVVAELDVNPLVVSNGRVVAVDALISLAVRNREE